VSLFLVDFHLDAHKREIECKATAQLIAKREAKATDNATIGNGEG
jgi:hypothetical protein